MNDYMKGNLRAARYFGMAMMMIVAFSFMANQVPGTAAASVAVGLSVAPDSTLLENVDTMSSDMPVATEGEDYESKRSMILMDFQQEDTCQAMR
jgi:hypothetical protein